MSVPWLALARARARRRCRHRRACRAFAARRFAGRSCVPARDTSSRARVRRASRCTRATRRSRKRFATTSRSRIAAGAVRRADPRRLRFAITASGSWRPRRTAGLGIVAWGVPVLALIMGAAGIVLARAAVEPDAEARGHRRRGDCAPVRATGGPDRAGANAGVTRLTMRRATRRGTDDRQPAGSAALAARSTRPRSRARLPAALARRSRQTSCVAGNIDDGTYRVLHDDYTARARGRDPLARRRGRLEADRGAARPAPDAGRRRSAASSCSRCVAAFLLAHAVGQRHAGRRSPATPGRMVGQPPRHPGRRASRRPRRPRGPAEELHGAVSTTPAPLLNDGDYTDAHPGVRRGGEARPEAARAADVRGWLAALVPAGHRRRTRKGAASPRRSRHLNEVIARSSELPRRVRAEGSHPLDHSRASTAKARSPLPTVPLAAHRNDSDTPTCDRTSPAIAQAGKCPASVILDQRQAVRRPSWPKQMPEPQTDSTKIYRVDDHDRSRHDRDGPRPAARAEHGEQLRGPRPRRLLRRPHVPPRRPRVRDPGRLPRGQRPRRTRLQVRGRTGEGQVHARRGRDGQLRPRHERLAVLHLHRRLPDASSRRATTSSATSSKGIDVALVDRSRRRDAQGRDRRARPVSSTRFGRSLSSARR